MRLLWGTSDTYDKEIRELRIGGAIYSIIESLGSKAILTRVPDTRKLEVVPGGDIVRSSK